MRKDIVKALLVMLVALGVMLPVAVTAAPGDPAEPVDLSWTANYTLFLTNATNNDQMYAAKAAVEAAGGRVGVILPFRVMLGWVDPGKAGSLVGKGGIKAVYQKPASGLPAGLTRVERDGVKYFNSVASGAYAAERVRRAATAKQGEILPDNREAPKISYADVVKNLEANGLTVDGLASKGIILEQDADGSLVGAGAANSKYMAGTVVYNAFFVESIGKSASGLGDLNYYTWTDAAHNVIMTEIISGLNFWVTQGGGSAYRVPLTFIYPGWYKFGNAGQTNYEPIKHKSTDDGLWINQIMANRGFSTGDKFARCAAFNAAMRNTYNTNWSVVTFTAYNPTPAPSRFTDQYFAYTWNTYIQMCYRNDGWDVSQYDIVNAHETGHIFGASDEYFQAGYGGCTSCTAASNGVLNGNCQYATCNPSRSQPCMMRGNTTVLCGYTPGQIGWTNLRSMTVSTASWAGVAKNFFVPGEKIQIRSSYCVAGPRLYELTHAVTGRAVTLYFGGELWSKAAPKVGDTGWYNAGSLTLPSTTGLSCYVTWVNTRVPLGVTYGAATVDTMIEVSGIGRGAAAAQGKFYVTGGATSTEDGSPFAAALPFEAAEAVDAGTSAK